MQTVYAYSGRDITESRRTLASWLRNDFTDGDVDVNPVGGEVRALIRKGLDQPIQFMRSMNGTGISFRRCWHHIRSRKAAVRLLYFIYQGELQVVSSGGSYTAKPGRCALINTDEPFYSETFVGERGSFECALAVVPEHLVLSRMPWANGLNGSFELGAKHRQVVTSLLDLLCFEGDHLDRQTAEPLTEAFLQSISNSMAEHSCDPRTRSLIDQRFADIQECIHKYLTCTELTYNRVAAYCDISPRYLCYVLKAHQTSFSDLLWSQRLSKARDWLVSAAFQRYPIHKVARMAGYKSAAHFSRVFKAATSLSPKEYRANYASMGNNAAVLGERDSH